MRMGDYTSIGQKFLASLAEENDLPQRIGKSSKNMRVGTIIDVHDRKLGDVRGKVLSNDGDKIVVALHNNGQFGPKNATFQIGDARKKK